MKKKKYNKDFEKHSKNKLYQFKIEKNNHKIVVSMFYFFLCPKNLDNLYFGEIYVGNTLDYVNNTLEIDLIGIFSPRKLKSYFKIISTKPLVVFQFISKGKVSPLKKEQTYKIENNQEFFLLDLKNFDKFHKTCGLKLLEPPKVIVNTTL
ncbi:MAG TPA: hypothetical protein PLP33_10685 [Leptospiraceae bacterium]|nr:hypothetical protein [Leptospiraceae bacterium]